MKKTVLHSEHERLGARLVDFAGWAMPIQYQSQLEEHHAVRRACGMFDVAHMSAIDIEGAGAQDFLRQLLANDAAKLRTVGKALYSCMLNPQGGVIDDLIVYRLDEGRYRLVVNAGTAAKDLAWMEEQAEPFALAIRQRTDLGILAVQGPETQARLIPLLPEALRAPAAQLSAFQSAQHGNWFIATTGYTGEDGYELILPHADLQEFWQRLLGAGVRPCGLGARDTLRLEAGMNLYGQDMDESVTPLECGLGWTIAWGDGDRRFIGRAVLDQQRVAPPRRQVGLVLEGRGVLRAHMPLRFPDGASGETTSGGFAPTLKQSIALARVEARAGGEHCEVEVRGQWLPARIVKPPFVRNGKSLI